MYEFQIDKENSMIKDYLFLAYNEYNELIYLYIQMINNISTIIKELNVENPIELTQIYTTILRKGALSKDKIYSYGDGKETLDVRGALGIDITNGEGVCRHISTLLSDIASCFNYESRTIKVRCGNYTVNHEKYDLPKKDTMILNFIGKISANHMITQIADKDINYIVDATNNYYLKYNKKNKFVNITNKDIIMKRKLIYDFTELLFATYQDRIINEKELNDKLLLPTVTEKELQDLIQKANKKIKEKVNDKFIDYLYNQNKEYYKEICELAKHIIYIWDYYNIPETKKLTR